MVESPQPSQVYQIPSPGPGALPGATSHVERLRLSSGAAVPTAAAERPERLGALIVTVTEGSSYDPIFQQVEQTDDQGLGRGCSLWIAENARDFHRHEDPSNLPKTGVMAWDLWMLEWLRKGFF